MGNRRREKALLIMITGLLGGTVFCTTATFLLLRSAAQAASLDDAPADRSPDLALVEIAQELTHPSAADIRIERAGGPDASCVIRLRLRGEETSLEVVPDPGDPLSGHLVWKRTHPRIVCRGIRPGGFRAMEMADGWLLKLEVIRMDAAGAVRDVAASKTVRRANPISAGK